MWKCASKCVKSTFHKGLFGNNILLPRKIPESKKYSLLKFTPALIERFNRYYGWYKDSCGKYTKDKKEREGPKEKKNSFLGGFDSNVFNALPWSIVFVLGYYFLQPFKKKQLSNTINVLENDYRTKLSGYQATLHYLIITFGLKPFNCVLPEVIAAKSIINNETSSSTNFSSQSFEYNEDFSVIEKAHQKVLGVLNNWLGTQHMQCGNLKEAIEYFIMSADMENASGIFNLGICYEKGLGTNQNFKKAAEFYQKATDLGHASAMYNLGVFYAQGLGGFEPDVNRARELFKDAARLGQKDAKRALILEKQALKEFQEEKSSIANNKSDKIVLSQSLPNTHLHQTLYSLFNSFNSDDEKEISRKTEDSFSCSQESSFNLLYDNDSGVLDLSSQVESENLLA